MRAAVRSHPAHRWFILGTVMLGTFMGPLDGSIANVSMPSIAHAFGHSVDEAEWIILAYLLVTASTLVLFGRLGDMFGQKRIYLVGFGIFGAGSLACALAPTLEALIAFRIVQGLGSAMLVSCTQALIVDTFPGRDRGRAIGLNGAAVAVGLSTGPILGGAITTYGDWRWIFSINIPITIVALILAVLILPSPRPHPQGFDPLGALCSVVGLLSASLAISRGDMWGWTSLPTLVTFGIAAVSLVAFIAIERRVTSPTLDLELFRNPIFSLSTIAAFVYFTAQSGVIFIVPLAAQLALGASPLKAGLMLIPLTVLNIVLAPIAGSLSDRIPARYVSTFGALLVTAGSVMLALLPGHPSVWQIVVALSVTGCGTAVFTQPNNSAIMGAAPANRRGIAAGTLATARTTGQLLGVATAGAVYFARAARLGPLAHTFAPATSYFAGVAGVMIVVALISYSRGEPASIQA